MLGFAGPVSAHESRPVFIDIVEQEENLFSVGWQVPPSVPYFNYPSVVLPESCEAMAPERIIPGSGAYARQRLFLCTEGLSGLEVGVSFPVLNPSVTTLIRLELLSGEKHTRLLSPKESLWRVPEAESVSGVAREYFGLGFDHILSGYDHLLFLACLILIAGTWRRILITVTGFTIAHSITLALAALGIFRVPIPPVDAAIALSIVFLATEIARGRKNSLTWRYPIAVSSSFGLLHGFGFASVLSQIGLPQTEIPAALLFFNIGVEVGQVLFAAAVIALFLAGMLVFRKLKNRKIPKELILLRIERPAAYIVGSFASFWMIERVAGFWV
ncbi:MAG: HupE/UreJ family protein [Sphingomonadales bacterium]